MSPFALNELQDIEPNSFITRFLIPDTLAILKDVGIAEPYGIFSVSAFANDWLTGANARQFPDLGISSDNLTYLVSSTTLRTAMEKHCL